MSLTGGSGQIQVLVPATLFRVLWGCSGVDELRPNDGETMHFWRSCSATKSSCRNSSSSSSSEVPIRHRTFPRFPSRGMQKSDSWRTTCGVERRNGNGKSQAATLILYQTRRFGAWKKIEETAMNLIYNKQR